MEHSVLLAQLRALIERAPNLDDYHPSSKEHLVWFGQGHALITRWNAVDAMSFQSAADSMSIDLLRPRNIAKILGTIQRAIADLELKAPQTQNKVFSAGDVYDFFKEMNRVISSAKQTIFIIDPFLDYTVVDHYLDARKTDVNVRLLLSSKVKDQIKVLKPVIEKYNTQYGDIIKVKKSSKLHDRVIFIDNDVCWVVGQSLKDAAIKPTYLLPLSPDVISAKLDDYENIWAEANEI
ncbi:phospholipase D-like domain-containing protein [Paraglaciecola hydrolytica]|uniref:Phospholipase D-like domain-containing protein n=1 Tax=Paraglaciecola hydrolytica TaxID=1799789 RepID=A0A136A407_9ALTE|nr:phospholipase D-like domain-containing protein [Paraglaciecola hydrolytica]KXI29978.1 hypothetical protein AX660_08175 [Paraglaciecola hydrolytica]